MVEFYNGNIIQNYVKYRKQEKVTYAKSNNFLLGLVMKLTKDVKL